MATVTRTAPTGNATDNGASNRRRISFRDPEWESVADRLYKSAGNRQRCLLVELLQLAEAVAGEFLSDHPEGCGCLDCEHALGGLNDAVQHTMWNAGMMASLIDGEVLSGPDLKNGTFGEQLRELADRADEIDLVRATFSTDDGDATPTAVKGDAR